MLIFIAAIAAGMALFAPLVVSFIRMGARFLFEERLPVGNGNLVIIGVDFGKSQKAVAIAAIFDKRGLK